MAIVTDVIDYLMTLNPNEHVLWQVLTQQHLEIDDKDQWDQFVEQKQQHFETETSCLGFILTTNWD